MAPSVTGTPQSFTLVSTSVFTYTGGGTADSSTWDIICVNSDTTITVPEFGSPIASRVNSQGAYIFAKSGGTTSATITLTGTFNTQALWVRITGANAVDVTGTAGVDGSGGTTTPSFTSSALAASDELALIFAALHSTSGAVPSGFSASTGYTVQVNGAQPSGSTGSGAVAGAVAVKTPAGTAAESPSISWSAGPSSDRYILFASFTAAAAGAGAIAPTGIAVAATPGSPALGNAGAAIAPTGVAVSATAGSPALGNAGAAIAPTGIAVAATPGSPALALSGVAPTGIAVTAATGSPALGNAGAAIAPAGVAVTAAAGTPASVTMLVPGTACAPAGIAVTAVAGTPSLRMVEEPGSWNSLYLAINEARAAAQERERRRVHPIDCPEHGWPLQPVGGNRYHCQFGGHVVTRGE